VYLLVHELLKLIDSCNHNLGDVSVTMMLICVSKRRKDCVDSMLLVLDRLQYRDAVSGMVDIRNHVIGGISLRNIQIICHMFTLHGESLVVFWA
jgi:hypothetical protein